MNINLSSHKSFGILLAVIFLIVHLVYYNFSNSIFIWLCILCLILSFTFPVVFKYPNLTWLKLGKLLGKILNPIVCTFLYIFAIGLTRLGLEIFRKKLILKKKNLNLNTYWIEKKDDQYKNFNNQF